MIIFELVYPLKMLIIKTMRLIQGYKIICLNNENQISANDIFAFNHSCFWDAPISVEVIKHHCYILVGI